MANQNKNMQSQQTATNAVITSYTNAQSSSMQSQANAAQSSQTTNLGNQNATGQQQAKSVIGVFSSRHSAETAVNQLRSQGFTTEEINIISKEQDHDRHDETEFYNDDVTDGALTGGTLGGIGGLILGAGALAIPGVGPIIAAGPIAAALSGAVAGGIAGGLIDWGIPAEASHRYEQSVAQGGILAVVRTQPSKVQQAAQILRQNGARDVETHNVK